MLNMIVRKMTLEDIDAVHAIECASIIPPWSRQGFVDGLSNENAVFYVAEADGDIAGYCGLYFAADEGEITNIAVAPNQRKQGIADEILNAVCQDGRDRGLAQIFLEVRASNLPAQRLYEKHGFTSQGIRKNFYRDPKEDGIIMMCQL